MFKFTDTTLAINGGDKIRDTMLSYGKQTISEDDIQAVTACLRDPFLTTGPRVTEFENKICDYTGAKHAIACSNGTAALHIACYAAGIGPGDEVIVSNMTFAASSNAVLYMGATVIFADINDDDMLMDIEHCKSLITDKTKAIVAVDMCGHPVNLDALAAICKEHSLVLIEDGAHSLGATYNGKYVGGIADITTLSFHPVKNITTGEGGMVTTSNDEYAARSKSFRAHGIDLDYRARQTQKVPHRYDMNVLGYNYRLTDIQCALGMSQLTRVDEFIARRQEIARMYDAAFAKVEYLDFLKDASNATNAHHIYVIKLNLDTLNCDRDQFFKALRAENIGVNVHYLPVHLHSYYRDVLKFPKNCCPKSVAMYERIITLPCFPLMTNKDVCDVVLACTKIAKVYAKEGVASKPSRPTHATDAATSETKGNESETLITNFTESDKFRSEIHSLIPGGAHTYSKGDDQFPLRSPACISHGSGSKVFDLDGNKYIDCSMGLTSVSLGHGYGPVLDAVREQLPKGVNFQRPAALERKMAQEFLKQVAFCGHDRVKFSKNGSTVTTASMKLARAYTKRKFIVRPHNHPFYSYDDWFISTTPCDHGIPDEYGSLTLTFDSMKPETLQALVDKYPGQIAGLITEPDAIADFAYTREFVAEKLREINVICKKEGIILIVDEMVSGYRSGFPGAIKTYNHDFADICCWGKSIGNGFSFCAMTGKSEIMDIGGIKEYKHPKTGELEPRVFLTSTTHGAETHGLSAALAVIKTFSENDVIGKGHRLVALFKAGMDKAVKDAGMEDAIEVHANTWYTLNVFKNKEGKSCGALRTLFLQEMIARGILFQGVFVPCYSHSDDDINQMVKAFRGSLVVYKKALAEGVEKYLVGDACKAVFRKWN